MVMYSHQEIFLQINKSKKKIYKCILKFFLKRTIGVLVHGHLNKLGQIIDSIYKNNLKISKMRQVKLTTQDAFNLVSSQRHEPNFK